MNSRSLIVLGAIGIAAVTCLVWLYSSWRPLPTENRMPSSEPVGSEASSTDSLGREHPETEAGGGSPEGASLQPARESLEVLFWKLREAAERFDDASCSTLVERIRSHGGAAAAPAIEQFPYAMIAPYCRDVLLGVGTPGDAALLTERLCNAAPKTAVLGLALDTVCALDPAGFDSNVVRLYRAPFQPEHREAILLRESESVCKLSGATLADLFVSTFESEQESVLRILLRQLCERGRGGRDCLFELSECYVARPELRRLLSYAIAVLHARSEALPALLALSSDARVHEESAVSPLREGIQELLRSCDDSASAEELVRRVLEADVDAKVKSALAIALGDDGRAKVVAEPLRTWYLSETDKSANNPCVYSLARLDSLEPMIELVNSRLSAPDIGHDELGIFASALEGVIRRDVRAAPSAAFLLNDVVQEFERRGPSAEPGDFRYLAKKCVSTVQFLMQADASVKSSALQGLRPSIDFLLSAGILAERDDALLRSALAVGGEARD